MLNQFFLFAEYPLPDEIWGEIAQYLEPNDLQALRLVCKQFLTHQDRDSLWQPLLNRLHALDNTITVTPVPGALIRDTFINGFLKIKLKQISEFLNIKNHSYQFNLSSLFPQVNSSSEFKYVFDISEIFNKKIKAAENATLRELEDNHLLLEKIRLLQHPEQVTTLPIENFLFAMAIHEVYKRLHPIAVVLPLSFNINIMQLMHRERHNRNDRITLDATPEGYDADNEKDKSSDISMDESGEVSPKRQKKQR